MNRWVQLKHSVIRTDNFHLRQWEFLRAYSAEELCDYVTHFDWECYPEELLGWAMAQKCIDLNTALDVFLKGRPGRYNYIARQDVAEEDLPVVGLIDNICLRINNGSYRINFGKRVTNIYPLRKWLRSQSIDRIKNRSGRWILDERIVNELLSTITFRQIRIYPIETPIGSYPNSGCASARTSCGSRPSSRNFAIARASSRLANRLPFSSRISR